MRLPALIIGTVLGSARAHCRCHSPNVINSEIQIKQDTFSHLLVNGTETSNWQYVRYCILQCEKSGHSHTHNGIETSDRTLAIATRRLRNTEKPIHTSQTSLNKTP